MFEVRPSKALPDQVAAFAVRHIKKGTVLDKVDSSEEVVILRPSDFKKLDPITRKKIDNFCVLDEDNEYCVPADLNNMGSSWYFNHSCSPNIAHDKKGNFVAARDIKKDEELFLDYARMIIDPKFRMKCACGAPNCRGTVTGRDWLDPKFRKDNSDKMWPDLGRAAAKKGKRQ
jgi:SET domain-containing protein